MVPFELRRIKEYPFLYKIRSNGQAVLQPLQIPKSIRVHLNGHESREGVLTQEQVSIGVVTEGKV